MSIGANTTTDNEITPGLNIRRDFEGDASTTRGDFYFGNNYSFNETLFDQLESASNLIGDGLITIESAAYQKALRINESIATNPTFGFDTLRFLTAYAKTTFPLTFFVNNQTANTIVNVTLDDARSFFQDHQYPDGFYCRQAPYDFDQVDIMFNTVFGLIGIPAGRNEGMRNYVVNTEDPGATCYAYQRQLNLIAELYPDPSPELETTIKTNLVTLYQILNDPQCEQLFPYGK